MKKSRLSFFRVLSWLAVAAVIGAVVEAAGAGDWRKASHQPTGIAPDPLTDKEAIVQVYVARAFSWRGAFGVHSWIAVKPTGAPRFTVYEVIGWRVRHGKSALIVHGRAPDARWFGSVPEIIADIRGVGVDNIIKRIDRVARAYPYNKKYHIWPGPNSNTFTAYIARAVPELRVDLPPTAIGKDYLTNGSLFAPAPSGTGYQISLFGLLGVLIGTEEGLEINLLGLTFGIDPDGPAIKFPMIGRIGPK